MPVRIQKPAVRNEALKPALTEKTRRRRSALKAETQLLSRAPVPRNDMLPKLAIEERGIASLKMPERQVRKLGPDDIAKVANSIRLVGACVPIIIGKNDSVINGVAVVEAAKSLGMATLPCVRLQHLTKSEERWLRIALNQIGTEREYDIGQLKIELQELELEDQPIRLLGFSDPQLDMIMAEDAMMHKPVADDDDQVAVVSRPGDVWVLGDHLLLCGDAKDPACYQLLMGNQRAQLALTDPPYAVAVGKVVSTKHRDFVEGGGDMSDAEFEAMIQVSFRNIKDALVDGGMLLSFMDFKHTADLVVIGKTLGMALLNIITWVKPSGGMGSLWRVQNEFVVALKKHGQHKNNIMLGKHGRDRSSVWEYAGAGTIGSQARQMLKDHPTPKPVAMLADAILDVTDREDIVLDPFGGSGSTLIACEQTGRHARLIEKDPL